jgi:4-hydroxyphenylpyruvate dioxygenase-like putative hemolysin
VPRFPFIHIDHVQLAMPAGEEQTARGFYCDLLGMAEVPKPLN